MKHALVKDRPFIQRSSLTGRWYFVRSWRDIGSDLREAHEKFDITDQIDAIIADAKAGDL